VGKHLQDHVLTFLSVEVDSKHNSRYAFETSEELLKQAEADYARDKSGSLALYNSSLWGGFLKLPGLEEMAEFKALDPAWQEYLSRERTPTYEFIANTILFPPGTKLPEGSSYLTTIAFLMNAQSEGSVTLSTSDPKEKPRIDLGYLQHPYDRRVMIEAIRQTWIKVYDNPEVKPYIKGRLYGPESLHRCVHARRCVDCVAC
jgi:choline dehydrogenase-like flavoprotein